MAGDGAKHSDADTPITTVPADASTCLGLSVELTIHEAPSDFASLAQSVKAAGGNVVAIAERPPGELASLWRDLDELGIPCDRACCLPPATEAAQSCPHQELSWLERYLWHKTRLAFEYGITHLVDHQPVVRSLFRKFLPAVAVCYPWELVPDIYRDRRMHDPELVERYRKAIHVTPPDPPEGTAIPSRHSGERRDLAVYTMTAEGEGFFSVIKRLGGEVLGSSPPYITGAWVVLLPVGTDIRHGPVAAGDARCVITSLNRLG